MIKTVIAYNKARRAWLIKTMCPPPDGLYDLNRELYR